MDLRKFVTCIDNNNNKNNTNIIINLKKINYCPICGDKLEIIIDEITDKTSEVESIMNII